MKVEVRGNDVNGAIKALKKKLYNEGLIAELRDRRSMRSRPRLVAVAAGKP